MTQRDFGRASGALLYRAESRRNIGRTSDQVLQRSESESKRQDEALVTTMKVAELVERGHTKRLGLRAIVALVCSARPSSRAKAGQDGISQAEMGVL